MLELRRWGLGLRGLKVFGASGVWIPLALGIGCGLFGVYLRAEGSGFGKARGVVTSVCCFLRVLLVSSLSSTFLLLLVRISPQADVNPSKRKTEGEAVLQRQLS